MDQHVQDELDLGLLYTTLRNSPTPSPQRLLATSEADPGASASSSPSSSSSSPTSISPSLPLDPETSYSHLCSLVFFGYLSPRPTRIFRIPFLGVEPSEVPEAALPLLLQPSIVTSSAHDRVVCALAQAHPPLAYAPQVSSIVLVLLQQLQWKEARAFGAASALIHQSRGALQTLVEEASRASCGEGGEGGEGEGGALLSSTNLPMPWLHLTRDFEAAYIRVFRALLRSSSERLSNHLEGLPSSSSSVSTREGGGGGGGGGGGRTLKHLLGEMFSGCLSGFLPPSDLGRFIDHFCHPRGGPVFMLRVALTMVLSVKGALLGAKDCGEVDRILRVWVATGAAVPATSPAAPTTNTTTTLLLPGTAYPYSWEALLDALGGEGAPDLPPHLLPTLLIRQDSAVVKSGVGVGWAGAAIAAGLVSPPSSPTTTPSGVAAAAAAPSGVWRGATWHNPAIVAKLPPGWVRDLVVARRGEGGGPPSPAGKGDISPTFRRTHSHPGLARALKRFCGGRLCTPDFSLPPLTRAANSSSSRGVGVGWVKKGGRGEEEEKMEEEEEEEEEERVGELLRASLANLPLPWPRQPHFFYQQQLNGSSTSSIKSRSASGGSKGDDEVGGGGNSLSSLTLSTLPSSSFSTTTSRDYYTPLWPLATLPTPASLLALLPPLAKDVNWCLQHSSDWVQQQQQLSGGGGVGRLVAALPQGGEPFVAFFSLELGTPLGGGDEPPPTPSSSPSFSSQSRPIFGVYCGGGIPPPGVPPPHTPPYTWLKAEPGDLAFQYLPDLAVLHWNAAAAFPTPPPPPTAEAAAVPLPAAGEGNLTSPSRFMLDPARFAVTAQRVVMNGGGGEGRGGKSPTAPPPPSVPAAALALFGCSTGGGSHFVVWDEDEERESTGGGSGGWCHAAASPALLSALGVPIPSRLLQQCAGGGVAGGVRVGPGWVGGDGVGIFSAPIRVKVGVVEVYSFTAPPPVDGGFGE